MSSYTWFTPAASPSSGSGGLTELGDVEVLGQDILFTDDFQLTAAGDYALVEGEANLRQGIFDRLQTRLGEFSPRPDYGVGARLFVKRSATKSNLDALRQRIREQLLLDSRVESVEEVSLELSQANGGAKLKVYVKVRSLGRYALAIDWTDGHNSSIYSWERLQSLADMV